MNTFINMQNICKSYYINEIKIKALNNVNIAVNEGDFTAIVGKSGSGKSTLMNIIGCLDTQDSGDYILNNKNVLQMNSNQLSDIRNRYIGFIFQSFNLVSILNALENVELPLIYRKMPKNLRRTIAREALIKVGLEDRMMHKPNQMSGGQQQRVAIARAIASRPPVILADEPTGNLDGTSSQEIINILKNLNNEGKTIIIITHDYKIAKQTNNIIEINDGEIISNCSHKNLLH